MSGAPDRGEGVDRDVFIRSRRRRNWALAACLLGLMLLFYLMTVAKFGEAIHRSLGTS